MNRICHVPPRTRVSCPVVVLWIAFLLGFCFRVTGFANPTSEEAIQRELAKGWNTWNTRSTTSFVHLPDGRAIDLCFIDAQGNRLESTWIDRRGESVEKVIPGAHSYDGSLTDQRIEWHGIRLRIGSVTSSDHLVLLIEPEADSQKGILEIRAYDWFSASQFEPVGSDIQSDKNKKSPTQVFTSVVPLSSKDGVYCTRLDSPLVVSTGGQTEYADAKILYENALEILTRQHLAYGANGVLHEAMQTVLAWNIIYDPQLKKVMVPVSRVWNNGWGGYVMFCWDSFFASEMLGMDNPELAYANILALLGEKTSKGFIPNFASGIGKSEDRSQPPVGSMAVWNLYQRNHDKWFLEACFDTLLSWNEWWDQCRNFDDYLCWGSNYYKLEGIEKWLEEPIGKKQAALYESGLDNSPLYDDSFFDPESELMLDADVGLMALYLADCIALKKIALELGFEAVAAEIEKRQHQYEASMNRLWDVEKGIYLNLDLHTKKRVQRTAPTHFYPLITGIPSIEHAERMINEHLLDPDKFWGTWVIPSISRDDPAFHDNNYWRGRIWAPMNYLVYKGLKQYPELEDTARSFASKSADILLKSWRDHHAIYENMNAESGVGNDVPNSDSFYHWGALNAYIALIEAGY